MRPVLLSRRLRLLLPRRSYLNRLLRPAQAATFTVEVVKEGPETSQAVNGPESALKHAPRSAGSTGAASSKQGKVIGVRTSFVRELHIRDFALVAEQTVEMRPGLNVVTGESGAGKSVLISALSQILGASAPENCIRQPAKEAVIEGRLHLCPAAVTSLQQLLQEHGVPPKALPVPQSSGSEVLLRREIFRGGKEGSIRSRCSINGASVSQRALREVGNLVVDVNGQHAAQSLRNSSTQIQLLDRLARTSRAASRFKEDLARLQVLEAELQALEQLGNEAAREDLQNMIDMASCPAAQRKRRHLHKAAQGLSLDRSCMTMNLCRPSDSDVPAQIEAHGLGAGEERDLRRQLREMQTRKANVERCGVIRTVMMGDSSSGGIETMLRNVESDIHAILDQERTQGSASSQPNIQAVKKQ